MLLQEPPPRLGVATTLLWKALPLVTSFYPFLLSVHINIPVFTLFLIQRDPVSNIFNVRASNSWAFNEHPSTWELHYPFMWVKNKLVLHLWHWISWGLPVTSIRSAHLIQNVQYELVKTPWIVSFYFQGYSQKAKWSFCSQKRYLLHQEVLIVLTSFPIASIADRCVSNTCRI